MSLHSGRLKPVIERYVSGLELGQRNPTVVTLWHIVQGPRGAAWFVFLQWKNHQVAGVASILPPVPEFDPYASGAWLFKHQHELRFPATAVAGTLDRFEKLFSRLNALLPSSTYEMEASFAGGAR